MFSAAQVLKDYAGRAAALFWSRAKSTQAEQARQNDLNLRDYWRRRAITGAEKSFPNDNCGQVCNPKPAAPIRLSTPDELFQRIKDAYDNAWRDRTFARGGTPPKLRRNRNKKKKITGIVAYA